MNPRRFLLLALLLLPALAGIGLADELTWPDAEARIGLAIQIAREMNDRALVERINSTAKQARQQIESGNSASAEEMLRAVEKEVGIDPGGWSMSGLKIFRPTKEMLRQFKELQPAVGKAMGEKNLEGVRTAVAELKKILGDQAGLPDIRQRGIKTELKPVTESEVVEIFLKALKSDEKLVRSLSSGKPTSGMKLRAYAKLVQGCCAIRPAVEKNSPDRVGEIDGAVEAACGILCRLQQKDGFFPFPDLRGENIRFGESIEKIVAKNPDAVKDGWLVVPEPEGGTQFDTGECGVAMLEAGKLYKKAEWTRAGLCAADWALGQTCVANFNYNAFSVSLLAVAHRVSGEKKYLEGAAEKFRLGVAPGQVENGRWLDPHNARMVYHVIILHAMQDLWEALPADMADARRDIAAMVTKAVGAVIEEFDAIGVTETSYALGELVRHERLNPDADKRLRAVIELDASAVWKKCVSEKGVGFGASPTEVAALTQAWR